MATPNENIDTPQEVRAQCDAFRETFTQLRSEIGKVMVGQQQVVDSQTSFKSRTVDCYGRD